MSCGNPFKHAIEDVKETFSKSCGVPVQGNDWCDLVSNYETNLDEVDYENEFEKIENHSFYFNISTESNKEQGVEVFQVRLKGQKTKERSMKEYSTHWI